ncbi:hypothetical protein SCHPADRAFT_694783 [Schizopora paradoxa]|uniref:Zn(2)-C6 fungal-type domain-containing protein n=1 Tax=Schizopora paradoxa TaxID=27342 RepID=A0A0H2R373_9AGAM|nr:hypothetical protein SCHPADRAFT_694783 [Schizopora paradoxa]
MFAESAPPHVMKGDLLDLDFTIDMDHRKRRRNRTTQSCLNCHTSKRKCDRKRPCQRCIQLGLTGLCVYEVDDPALRDDPDIDETTRLRNRIAELESLVRELRGKPHPRWADPNYYEGDASDKWHTRSQKRNAAAAAKRRPQSPSANEVSVKTEPGADLQHQHHQHQHQANGGGTSSYYRLSPSPPGGATQQQQQQQPFVNVNVPTQFSPPSAFDSATGADGSPVTTYSPSSPAGYGSCGESGSSSSNGGGGGAYNYPPQLSNNRKLYGRGPAERNGRENGNGYNQHHHNGHHHSRYDGGASCPCITNPAAGHAFVNLARQLEAVQSCLHQLPEHNQHTHCGVHRRVQELSAILQ